MVWYEFDLDREGVPSYIRGAYLVEWEVLWVEPERGGECSNNSTEMLYVSATAAWLSV